MTSSFAPRRSPARTALGLLGVAGLVAASSLASGCSTDTHRYLSTATAPKSVYVRYVETGETAWSRDIPEGHELKLDFERPGEGLFRPMPDRPATKMKWKIKQVSVGSDDRGRPVDEKMNDSGTVDLTGLPVQMDVEVHLQDAGRRGTSGRTLEAPSAGGAG